MSIPKIAHRIWFGEPFPEKYKKYLINLVELNPDYIVKLWSDPETVSKESYQELIKFCNDNRIQLNNIRDFVELKNYDSIIEELDASKMTVTNKKLHYVRASDVSRKSIILMEGGIYTDTDSKMLASFPKELSEKSLCLKGADIAPEELFYFFVEDQPYHYFFDTIYYDFIAAEASHPLINLATEVVSVDYKTWHDSQNRGWENSVDLDVLCWGTVRLTGTALKYALNVMHQSGNIPNNQVPGLFYNTDSFMQGDFDKSWLEGFQKGDGSDPWLDNFFAEIDVNRRHAYFTKDHGSHPWTLLPSAMLNVNKPGCLALAIELLPKELFDHFWKHMKIANPEREFANLAILLKKNLFEDNVTKTLAKAIFRYYSRFGLAESFLFWSLETGNPEFLKAALLCYNEDQRVEECKILNTYGYTALQRASRNPVLLGIMLESLPQHERLPAINIMNKYGSTVIILAADNPESLKVIFESLPGIHHQNAITVYDNSYGLVLRYVIKEYLASLAVLLKVIPQDLRLNAVTEVDKFGNSVLAEAVKNPPSLKIILAFLSEAQQLLFFRMRVNNQSVLEVLRKNQITVTSADDAFQKSFVPDYMAICNYLAEMKVNIPDMPLFFNQAGYEAAQLLKRLDQYQTFDEMKEFLVGYTCKNQNSPVSREIMTLLPKDITVHGNELSYM